MKNSKAFQMQEETTQHPVEIFKPSEHRTRSTKCEETIRNEIRGILASGAFKYVNRKQRRPNANVLGGRYLLTIKQPETEAKRYIAIFIVQGHPDKEKENIIHISKTVRHKISRF